MVSIYGLAYIKRFLIKRMIAKQDICMRLFLIQVIDVWRKLERWSILYEIKLKQSNRKFKWNSLLMCKAELNVARVGDEETN